MSLVHRRRLLLVTGLAFWFGLARLTTGLLPAAAADPMSVTLRSTAAHPVPAEFRANARLP